MADKLTLRRGDRLVLATHNAGKLKEFKELLDGFGLEIVSAGVHVLAPGQKVTVWQDKVSAAPAYAAQPPARPAAGEAQAATLR